MQKIKDIKRSTNFTTLVDRNNPDTLQPERIRAHAFQFTLKLPNILHWKQRGTYLDKHNIQYTPSLIGQKLYYKNKKIWLTNKSIVINEPSNYLAKTAKDGKSYAVYDFLNTIKSLERLLNCSFKHSNGYKFRVSRQHYADLKNLLARQYRNDKKKLGVYDGRGLWLWVDYSDGIDELETDNRQDSDDHMDNIVAPFFNGLKDFKGEFTPKWVVSAIGEVTRNQAIFDANMASHIRAVQALGTGVDTLNNLLKKLNSVKGKFK